MGFFSFMGHRLLAVLLAILGGFLLLVAFSFFIAWQLTGSAIGIVIAGIFVILGIISLIAFAYFRGTKH